MIDGLFTFLGTIWSSLSTLVSSFTNAINILLSYVGILPQFASMLPSTIMNVICSMFLLSITLICLKALLQKV